MIKDYLKIALIVAIFILIVFIVMNKPDIDAEKKKDKDKEDKPIGQYWKCHEFLNNQTIYYDFKADNTCIRLK